MITGICSHATLSEYTKMLPTCKNVGVMEHVPAAEPVRRHHQQVHHMQHRCRMRPASTDLHLIMIAPDTICRSMMMHEQSVCRLSLESA